MAKVITVFGATGAQGGPVANALLEDSDFKVRAVTRNASSDKARALQERGAEIVQANCDDPATLGPALEGAHGTFLVTTSANWEPEDFKKQVKQGKAVADAAKAAGVQHVVFSSVYFDQKIAGFPCPHLDTEVRIEEYMTSLQLPLTVVRYPFYYENYTNIFKPQKQADGTYVLAIPMEGAAMDGGSVSDMGVAVRTIFQNRDQWLCRSVDFSGDKLTIQQHADILNKHLAPKVFKATDMTADAFGQLGFPGAEYLGNMFKFSRLSYNPDCSVDDLTRQLNPAVKNFDTWVAGNKEALLNALD